MMNWAHVHLLVNHVPILASLFAALFFVLALRVSTRTTWTQPGLVMLGIAVAGAFLAYLTGDPAADAIQGQARTSGHALEEHHVRATVATIIAGATAVAGVAAVFTSAKNGGAHSRRMVIVLLIATL